MKLRARVRLDAPQGFVEVRFGFATVVIQNGERGIYMEHVNIGAGYLIKFDCLPNRLVGVKEDWIKEIK